MRSSGWRNELPLLCASFAHRGKDGRLPGRIKITRGDESTFIAEKAATPIEPIPDPPSYRNKWRRW